MVAHLELALEEVRALPSPCRPDNKQNRCGLGKNVNGAPL